MDKVLFRGAARLSEREAEILGLVALGRTNRQNLYETLPTERMAGTEFEADERYHAAAGPNAHRRCADCVLTGVIPQMTPVISLRDCRH